MVHFMSDEMVKQQARQPTILVNVAGNDPTRGDVAGWKGLANTVAKKVDGHVVYADYAVIAKAYPDEFDVQSPDRTKYNELLARYLEPYGPPEYLFGHHCIETMRALGQGASEVLNVTDINEGLSRRLLNERVLVSHHLTPDVLKEEGALFDKNHPDIKGPIISVFLVDPYTQTESFADKVVNLMANYQEATIYLCASRRTHASNYEALETNIKEKLEASGLNERIDLLGYAPEQKNAYNPYKGLIARAKHFVVWGNSLSMMSEALYSGKTVYLHQLSNKTMMKWRGLTRTFNDLSEKKLPYSKAFTPINLTERIADALLKQHKDDTKTADKALVKSLTHDEKQWAEHLKAIRQNFTYAAQLDEGLKANPDFVKAALRVRGFTLQYFPLFQNKKDAVITAAQQNKNAYKFSSEELRDDEDTILALLKEKSIHCGAISEKLLAKKSFAQKAVALDCDVFCHLPAALRADRDLALLAITQDAACYNYIDKTLLDDAEFANDAVDANIRAYMVVIHKNPEHDTKDFAMRALKKDFSVVHYSISSAMHEMDEVYMYILANGEMPVYGLSHKQNDKEDLVLACAKIRSRSIGDASPRLQNDRDFILSVLKNNAQCINHILPDLRNDKDFMLQALCANPDILEYNTVLYKNKILIAKAVRDKPEIYEQIRAIDDRSALRARRETSTLNRIWNAVTKRSDDDYISRDPDIMQLAAQQSKQQQMNATL